MKRVKTLVNQKELKEGRKYHLSIMTSEYIHVDVVRVTFPILHSILI
jgi:hypothetical protein